MRRIAIAFVVLYWTVLPSFAETPPPVPNGWRVPAAKDLTEEFRKRSPVQYLVVRGDFDGDGAPDVARLLVSANGKTAGLIVTFGGAREDRGHLVLDRWEIDALPILGIRSQPVGNFPIVCRDRDLGYDWCRLGEATVFRIKNSSILGFFDEKSSFVYYWRGTKFHKVWTSD